MPFFTFSRDRRGYEHFSLVQPSTRRGKSQRILYWFRTPPNVRVGRDPFDPATRRALEASHPDLVFEWDKLLEVPIPRAEPEHWRERRDAVRRAKVAQRQDDQPEVEVANEELQSFESPASPDLPVTSRDEQTVDAPPNEPAVALETSSGEPPQERVRRRRRRRRGRRGRPATGGADATPQQDTEAPISEEEGPEGDV